MGGWGASWNGTQPSSTACQESHYLGHGGAGGAGLHQGRVTLAGFRKAGGHHHHSWPLLMPRLLDQPCP